MSNIELKPCPFCGGVAVELKEGTVYGLAVLRVSCKDCGASTRFVFTDETEKPELQTAELWNRRASDE